MFKKLISVLAPILELELFLSKNRRRFENIHSSSRSNDLEFIYVRLLNGMEVDNGEIMTAYHSFSSKIQTNTFAAAELEWVTISTLCYYRSELTPQLIRPALLCIVSSIGDEITATDVFDFINERIVLNNERYGGHAHPVGMKWLKEILPKQVNLVQETLEDVILQNRKEFDKMWN